MFKSLILLSLVVSLSGCAAPRYSGGSIESAVLSSKPAVVVVQDGDTREGFLETIEEWLKENNYSYVVAPDHSKHEHDKLTLEYVGKWRWDLALYLSEAEIEAFQGGQRVGKVEFSVPNSLNTSKFGVGATRIRYMLDALFGRISVAEATKKVNGRATHDK